MQSRKRPMKLLPMLAAVLVVSGCGNKVTIRPVFPPAPDVQALQEEKPRATPDIVTSAKAEAEYNASLESWGERLSASGRRLCIWLKDQGAKDISCR